MSIAGVGATAAVGVKVQVGVQFVAGAFVVAAAHAVRRIGKGRRVVGMGGDTIPVQVVTDDVQLRQAGDFKSDRHHRCHSPGPSALASVPG